MADKITNSELKAGAVMWFTNFLLQSLFVYIGLITTPAAFISLGIIYGAYGFVLLVALFFALITIVILGYLGDNIETSLVFTAAIWLGLGFLAISAGLFTLQYYILGLILVIVSAAIANRVMD
jgi:hypothetical protein